MNDIWGCKCSECDKWHSHVSPDGKGKWVCVNCKYKIKGEKNGKRNL